MVGILYVGAPTPSKPRITPFIKSTVAAGAFVDWKNFCEMIAPVAV